MIIKGLSDTKVQGRRFYPLNGMVLPTRHFVVRTTTPDNPFEPHVHEDAELWYIIAGEGELLLGEETHKVVEGDLIRLDPWVRHGLQTRSELRWICLG